MKKPLVSILIVNFNSGSLLESCLKSIENGGYDKKEVIIVDNGSVDASLKNAIASCSLKLKIVRLNSNFGFAKGNNIGAIQCNGKYVVLLNNDTLVKAGWLDHLVDVINSDSGIGIVQPKLMQVNKFLFDSTGDFIDCFGQTFRRGFGKKDVGQYECTEEIFSARGAALLIRRDLFISLKFLDDFLFNSYEDIDLSWRARLIGYKVVYVPQSIVYHVGGVTVKKFGGAPLIFNQTRNLLIVFLKNQDFWQLIRRSPIALIVGCMSADLIKKRVTYLFARLKALFKVLCDFPQIYSKRLEVKKFSNNNLQCNNFIFQSDIPDLAILFFNSIIYGEEKALEMYLHWLWEKSLMN